MIRTYLICTNHEEFRHIFIQCHSIIIILASNAPALARSHRLMLGVVTNKFGPARLGSQRLIGDSVSVNPSEQLITELLMPHYQLSQLYNPLTTLQKWNLFLIRLQRWLVSYGCHCACRNGAGINAGALLLENRNCQSSSI